MSSPQVPAVEKHVCWHFHCTTWHLWKSTSQILTVPSIVVDHIEDCTVSLVEIRSGQKNILQHRRISAVGPSAIEDIKLDHRRTRSKDIAHRRLVGLQIVERVT